LHVAIEREKTDNKVGAVSSEQINNLQETYPNSLSLINISQEEYETNQNKICAATYYYDDKNTEKKFMGIDATQINQPDASSNSILEDEAIKEKVDNLNTFLTGKGQPHLQNMEVTN
jgi:hypothetical protein